MKKEIIIIITIIITMAILHFTSEIYMQNFFKGIYYDLDIIGEILKSEDINENDLKNNMEDIMKKWNDRYNYIACYIEHDELEKVQLQLASIKANIEIKDYEQSYDELEKCKFIMKHIEDKDSFKIINIF